MKKLLSILFMFFITKVSLFGQSNDIWASFKDETSGAIGYKDKNGIIKVEPKFIRAPRRFDNIIIVTEDFNGKSKEYYLTKSGKIVGRDSLHFYDKQYDCESEGFIRFRIYKNRKNIKIGMFNRYGNVAIPAEYDWLERVTNGMIIAAKMSAKKNDGLKYALIDTLNSVLIDNFHGNNLDMFSIEKTEIPHPDIIRISFLAKDGSYYSFIDVKKEFKQWLTGNLLLNLTAEKLIRASHDTIFWPSAEGLGASNARQFVTDNFDFLKKELLEVLNPDCNDCFMGNGTHNMVVPEKYHSSCGYPIAMEVIPRRKENVFDDYYSFLRTSNGYKLTYVNIERTKGVKY